MKTEISEGQIVDLIRLNQLIMKNTYQILFFIIYILFHIQVNGQQMGLNPIAKNNELPSLTINQTCQDKDGYIWFASTQGLSRYDAYNILNFKLKTNDGKTATNQNIKTLIEYQNYLILGTDKGLYTLEKESYLIKPFQNNLQSTTRITTLLIDKKNRLWVGSDNGIVVYNKDLSIIQNYQDDHNPIYKIPSGTVNTIFEDKKGNIWVAIWEQGLFKLDIQTNQFIAYPKLGTRNNPFKLFEDHNKQLWVCTWGDGVYLFNPNNKKNLYQEIEIKNKRRNIGKEDLFYNIVQDRHRNYIWILSFSGISTFQYINGALKEVNMAPYFDHTTNIFNDIYQDRLGTLWLSIGGKGISTISFDKPLIQNYTFKEIKSRYSIAPNVNMLYRDEKGIFWFNLERFGFGSLNPNDGLLNTYSNANLRELISIRAASCAIDVQHELWVGSAYEATINVFEKQHNNIKLNYKIDLKREANHSGVPIFFFQDNQSGTWIATNQGVLYRDAKSKKIKLITKIKDQAVSIAEDKKSNIWIATKGSGIYYINKNDPDQILQHIGQSTAILKTNQIESLDIDKNDNLWIGTKDNRLLYYQTDLKKMEELANSALFGKNQLLDIVCLDNTVWLSSTRNIFKINALNKDILEFTSTDSLQVNMFSKRAFTIDKKSNSVYFGGYNGMVRLDDNSNIPNYKAKVQVTDIKINNKSIVLESNQKKFNFNQQILTLEPDDQNIEFSFSSLGYTQDNKLRYAYKLEGIDQDWINASRDRVFAAYNNLGKGSYRFLIKSTDLNNKWNTTITEINIYKKAAFYESNLAYFLYVCLLIGIFYYFINFTLHRLKLRSDLKIAQIEKENAHALAQSKLSYFTGISHDLLTPLTIISCLVDDVQMTTNHHLSQFEKMRLNLDRLKRLLQQILDFRRIENNLMELKVSQEHLPTFINQLSHVFFSPLAIRKNIEFEINHGECTTDIYYDADKMDKILFNLLSNAFKYTPKDGKISLSYYIKEDKKQKLLYLFVRDNGMGIDKDELDKIFKPFYTNKSFVNQESNGIGLSVTKELVDIHFGEISVESLPDQGTCFQIVLPVGKEFYVNKGYQIWDESFPKKDELIYDISDVETVIDEITSGDLHKLHILLVEDNEDLQQTMSNILSKKYHVHVASDGKKGLDLLNKVDIDIIVSDIMMPEMDGLSLCRAVKQHTEINHIPVLLLTAKNSIEDRIECYQAGADGYISKPFDIKVLEAKIQSFIINKRTKQINFNNNTQINIATLDYTPIDEQFLQRMIKVVEENLSDDQFDIIKLGEMLALSKSTLYRKTKVLLDLSPSEFIKNIRLKHACQMMEKDKSITVSEVAFATGFSDPRYFATCFKASFGITPTEFQKNTTIQHV